MEIVKRNTWGGPEIVMFNNKWTAFKEWVEQTKLFCVIKEETQAQGRNNMFGQIPTIMTTDPYMSFTLKPNVYINAAEDLPQEILLEFYKNSPFYSDIVDVSDTLKLLK